MAVNNDAVFVPANGFVLTGNAATAAKPTPAMLAAFVANRATVPTGFTEVGQTSIETLPNFARDVSGGDPLTAWSGDTVGTTAKIVGRSITWTSIQFDGPNLQMYEGGGTVTAGYFDAPDITGNVDYAVLVVIASKPNPFAFMYYRVGVSGADAISLDAGSNAGLPMSGTVLKRAGSPPYSVISASITAP